MRAVVLVTVLCGCVTSESTRTGPVVPPRPMGCEVKVFPASDPDYPVEDLGTAHQWSCANRTTCIARLMDDACKMGGDTLYKLKDGPVTTHHEVYGTIARRKALAPAPAPTVCNPICSPGFACQAGECVPQCNPACAAGSTCGPDRTCHPSTP